MSELKHDQYPYLPRGKASLLIQIACFMSRNRKQMLLKIKKKIKHFHLRSKWRIWYRTLCSFLHYG